MADQQPDPKLPVPTPPPDTAAAEPALPEQPVVPERAQTTAQRYSLTQKQRHLGERLIEWGIRATATLSIVFIFLIFFYVFRQAAPIFFGSDEQSPASLKRDSIAAATPDQPSEVYGAVTDSLPGASDSSSTDSSAGLAGRTPGTTAGSDSSDESDHYNPGAADIPVPTRNDPARSGAPAQTDEERAREIVGADYPILTLESPVRLGYLAHFNWQPNSEHPRYGIYPLLVGTLKTTLIALLIAIPLSILAALYSAFFAPKWIREYLKPAIEVLAGFPSVVLGFFCLMTVATLVQMVFGVEQRLNAVVGGIGLALAVIPIIYTISDDALRAVPQSLREAALALGASEWQAAYKVMLPAATPGILAAVLLGLGRAFGETMIALLATGNAGTYSWNFFESVRTLAATIGSEMGEVVNGSPHYQVLFLLGILLFLFSFLINLVTEFYIKARLIKRFRGEE